MRFKLYIEYSGSNYSGWQVQKNAKTVMGKIIDAIETVFEKSKGHNKFKELYGSGRTDAGVHALEQVAHLECETMLAPEILKMKLNDELPSDINILEIEKVDNKFHARHSAKSRQYLYQISKRRTAFEKKFVWWIKDELDVAKMQEAAKVLEGFHNFATFSDDDDEFKSTLVQVDFLEVFEDEDKIYIRIKASHFLWKMVRRIVGVLAEVGRGKLKIEEVKKFLEEYSEKPSRLTAPPSGLFLEKIYY